MILYHGSHIAVPQPLAKAGRKKLCILNQKVIDLWLQFVESKEVQL